MMISNQWFVVIFYSKNQCDEKYFVLTHDKLKRVTTVHYSVSNNFVTNGHPLAKR